MKIVLGALVKNHARFALVLAQSKINAILHPVLGAEDATKGFNHLLEKVELEGNDIAVLTHEDMYYQKGFLEQLKGQIAKLPEDWIVAGIWGKDMDGKGCGNFRDMRFPKHFFSKHEFPHPACCVEECCIIVNLKKGFRFDEALKGFHLYGTVCVLQAKEMGGSAWILDAYAEHYSTRPYPWYPDRVFADGLRWIKKRFPNADRIDNVALTLTSLLENIKKDGVLVFNENIFQDGGL